MTIVYFDANQRAEQLTQIDINIKIQRDALKAIQADNEKLDDATTVKRNYNYFIVERNEDNTIESCVIDDGKVARVRRLPGLRVLMAVGGV